MFPAMATIRRLHSDLTAALSHIVSSGGNDVAPLR